MATMKHVKGNTKWKKLEISPSLLSKKDFDSLISFEELTDYEIIDSQEDSASDSVPITTSAKSKKNKRKQKKNFSTESLPSESKTSNKSMSERNKVKKKRKKAKNKKNKEEKELPLKSKHGRVLVIDSRNVHDVNEEGGDNSGDKEEVLTKTTKRKLEKDVTDCSKPKKTKTANIATDMDEEQRTKVTADMAGWKNLFVPSAVLKALKHQGFTSPTSIQALTLPSAIRDRMDIVGAAETGSGKTLAFGIPILHHILQYKEKQREKHLSQDKEDTEEEEESSEEKEGREDDKEIDDVESEAETDSELDGDDDDDDDMVDLEQLSDGGNSEDEKAENSDDGSDSGVQEDIPAPSDSEDEDGDFDLPPEEEDLADLEDGVVGCVKVINDVEMDFPELEQVKPDTDSKKPLMALILEPTRELAIQVKNHLMAAAKYTDIRIATVVGGMAPQKQQRVLKQCPEIVIATPGRLWELIQQGDPHLSKVTRLHKLVIDEADRMVEKGHFEELTRLLEMINENAHQKRKRQTFVFSATLTMLHSGPQRHIKKKKKKKEKMDSKKKLELLMETIGIKERPKIVDLTTKTGTAETLTEARINCTTQEKDQYLYYFLKQYPGRTLVFTNSKDCIRRLVSIFTLLRCCPLPLHADMHQRQRLKNLDKFSGSGDSLLIASDVAARGLDIPDIQHVIHYQVPRTIENYVHRSGRTARAMKEGLSVMLVGPEDVSNYRKIIQNLNHNEDLPLFPVEYHAISSWKPIINLARQIDTEDHRFKKKKHKNDWFVKTAEEMDMLLDDRVLEDPSDREEQQKHKHRQQMLRSQLEAMLRQPLVQKTYSGKYPTKMGKLMTPKQADDHTAVQKVKKDHPEQKKMMDYLAAHPKVAKKKKDNRKTRKNEKRKKKKMKMMNG